MPDKAGAGPRWEDGPCPDHVPGALHRSPLIEASASTAVFNVPTVGRFLVRPDHPVVVQRAAHATDHDVDCMVVGPVAALQCCLERRLCLRGTAVDIGGLALVAFGGVKGTSSLGAALALGGGRVLADGVVCVGGSPLSVWAPHGNDRGRTTLWPDTVKALCLDPSKASVVRPVLASRTFQVGEEPSEAPVTLAALVLPALDLSLGGSGPLVEQDIIGPSAAVAALRDAVWHSPVWADLGRQSDEFQLLTEMAVVVPISRVRRSDGSIAATLKEMARLAEEMLP